MASNDVFLPNQAITTPQQNIKITPFDPIPMFMSVGYITSMLIQHMLVREHGQCCDCLNVNNVSLYAH